MPPIQAALRGVNAAVVGILLAALYTPVWTSAIFSATDFALALGAFLLLAFWKWPAWLVVVLTALAGAAVPIVCMMQHAFLFGWLVWLHHQIGCDHHQQEGEQMVPVQLFAQYKYSKDRKHA